MIRFLLPLVLIGIAVGVFFTFTDPLYIEITDRSAQIASFDEALDNSQTLERERDKLTEKYNSIGAENISRLTKFLPENVDNIRLILEIEKIASPYGMILKDVKYSPTSASTLENGNMMMPGGAPLTPQEYGIWDLEFSTSGSYTNLINFIRDLERNLRIVDIASIDFSSNTTAKEGAGSEIYNYQFHIKTYWLKN